MVDADRALAGVAREAWRGDAAGGLAEADVARGLVQRGRQHVLGHGLQPQAGHPQAFQPWFVVQLGVHVTTVSVGGPALRGSPM